MRKIECAVRPTVYGVPTRTRARLRGPRIMLAERESLISIIVYSFMLGAVRGPCAACNLASSHLALLRIEVQSLDETLTSRERSAHPHPSPHDSCRI